MPCTKPTCEPADTAGAQDVSQHRKRNRGSDSPLSVLIDALKRSQLPTIEPAQANSLLAGYVREALRHDDAKGTLLALVTLYGWEGSTGCFNRRVDLFGLQTALQVSMFQSVCSARCLWWGREDT